MASQSHVNKQVANLLREILFELRVMNGAEVHEAIVQEIDDELETAAVGVIDPPAVTKKEGKNATKNK